MRTARPQCRGSQLFAHRRPTPRFSPWYRRNCVNGTGWLDELRAGRCMLDRTKHLVQRSGPAADGSARRAVTSDFEAVDFFSDVSLFDDPYPYFDHLREQNGPVWIEPVYGVAMVTGHDEEVAVLRDHETFSSINAP